jgi:hypothetical protein
MVVVRAADEALKFPNPRFWTKPQLEEIVPPESRSTRERMIAIANGYFSTLECNDGTILTKFHADANRVENGVQTTNNPDFFVPVRPWAAKTSSGSAIIAMTIVCAGAAFRW